MEIDSSYNTRIKEKLLDILSKESLMVVSTAYLYAKNYVNYGCDITKEWSTAVEQASILERVKTDAQYEVYDSLKKDYETELKSDMEAVLDKLSAEIEDLYSYCDFDEDTKTCYNMIRLEEVQRMIDKYKAMYCNPLSQDRKIESIPYLMHKELDVPISECQKAYDAAIDYLRSQGKIKG